MVDDVHLLLDPRFRALATAYLQAKRQVVAAGFWPEVDWQEDTAPETVSEGDFLREAAWVVLSSGFRERTVRARFPQIELAFGGWRSARWIDSNRESCRAKALAVFANAPKIDAILAIARHIGHQGMEAARQECARDPITFLSQFPYLGPITTLHLAKNLGYAVSKPDRHLVRLAGAAGFTNPQDMCLVLANGLSEKVSVVDIVLWRHAVLTPGYETIWRRAVCES